MLFVLIGKVGGIFMLVIFMKFVDCMCVWIVFVYVKYIVMMLNCVFFFIESMLNVERLGMI